MNSRENLRQADEATTKILQAVGDLRCETNGRIYASRRLDLLLIKNTLWHAMCKMNVTVKLPPIAEKFLNSEGY